MTQDCKLIHIRALLSRIAIHVFMPKASDNPSAPVSVSDYNGRTLTDSFTNWTIPPFTIAEWHDSNNIRTVIQEVIDRPGWSSGNAMLIFHKDNDSDTNALRNIGSYDLGSTYASKLYIEYSNASWTDPVYDRTGA